MADQGAGNDRCTWGGYCRNEAVGHMHYQRATPRLCTDHMDPAQHPPDLRDPRRFCRDGEACSGF